MVNAKLWAWQIWAWQVAFLAFSALVVYVFSLARRVRLLENWKKLREEVQNQQTSHAIIKLTNIAEHQQQQIDKMEPHNRSTHIQ